MLAREIIEDSVLPFLTREDPNLELAGEAISQKVILSELFIFILIFFVQKFSFWMNLLI